MNIKKLTSIYFSPNGSTKKIVEKLTEAIEVPEKEKLDLTFPKARDQKRIFENDELLVIGFPIYGDRLPITADDIFENLSGKNTLAVVLVSYGNRDYGDGLLELKNKLEKRGFKIIGGTAIIGEHCLNTNIANGRPDRKDCLKILEFGNNIDEKIKDLDELEKIESIKVKGEYPYHPLKSQRTPSGDSKCIQCGRCQANCPVKAISMEDFRITDSDICIFCGKCIQVCPTNARDIKNEDFVSFMEKLETIAGERREIEVFF